MYEFLSIELEESEDIDRAKREIDDEMVAMKYLQPRKIRTSAKTTNHVFDRVSYFAAYSLFCVSEYKGLISFLM